MKSKQNQYGQGLFLRKWQRRIYLRENTHRFHLHWNYFETKL